MSKVIPFKALVSEADVAQAMVSPPCDTVNIAEARRIVDGNPHSYLHITKAQVDLDPEVHERSDQVYQKAAANLERFKERGLFDDCDPSYYIYRQSWGEYVQTGLVAGASVQEYEEAHIRKHERIREKLVADRACHSYVVKIHAEPVMLVHRSSAAIAHLVNDTEARVEPLIDIVDREGVQHQLWRGRNTVALQKIYQGLANLYIADGHHLCEAALRVRDIMRKANPSHTGMEAYNYFPAVIYPDDEVRVLEYSWDGDPAQRPLSTYSISDIMRIADEGGYMPPKSTWFAPKLGCGLFVYEL